MITAKQIRKRLEDFNANSYPVGNVDSFTLLTRNDIKKKIEDEPGFAEKVLDKLVKSDYSYYINGESLKDLNLNELKSTLLNNHIDIVYQVVNYYQLS